ncbi:MAG: hypothetical protein L0J32_13770, partial [Brevibacterium sp.]|nr:hypothetical protein [Brevibacterium sp.]
AITHSEHKYADADAAAAGGGQPGEAQPDDAQSESTRSEGTHLLAAADRNEASASAGHGRH